jgi:hypothetical protein
MAILRAGPFATSSDSFVSIDGTWNGEIPVNCAKDSKSFWRWRFKVVGNDEPFDGSFLEVEEGLTTGAAIVGNQPDGILQIEFYYQAAEEWSFDGSEYTVSKTTATDEPVGTQIVVFVGEENEVFSDSDFQPNGGPSSVQGNIDSIVFPAAVVPQYVKILLQANSDFTGAFSVGITLPIDSK